MRTLQAAARGSRKAPDPVETQRHAIEEALGKLTDPIVVVIDDIDRLTPDEVRSMLGLVRLTAHFPKVIYLLAFDRAKVERALNADGLEDGRSYLEKIVEVVYDMPAVSQPRIERLVLDGLEQLRGWALVRPGTAGRPVASSNGWWPWAASFKLVRNLSASGLAAKDLRCSRSATAQRTRQRPLLVSPIFLTSQNLAC